MVKRYVAEIKPVNENITGSAVRGKAELIDDGDTLTVKIEATGTPPNMMHWSHFHGFTDNRIGRVPTMEDDKKWRWNYRLTRVIRSSWSDDGTV